MLSCHLCTFKVKKVTFSVLLNYRIPQIRLSFLNKWFSEAKKQTPLATFCPSINLFKDSKCLGVSRCFIEKEKIAQNFNQLGKNACADQNQSPFDDAFEVQLKTILKACSSYDAIKSRFKEVFFPLFAIKVPSFCNSLSFCLWFAYQMSHRSGSDLIFLTKNDLIEIERWILMHEKDLRKANLLTLKEIKLKVSLSSNSKSSTKNPNFLNTSRVQKSHHNAKLNVKSHNLFSSEQSNGENSCLDLHFSDLTPIKEKSAKLLADLVRNVRLPTKRHSSSKNQSSESLQNKNSADFSSFQCSSSVYSNRLLSLGCILEVVFNCAVDHSLFSPKCIYVEDLFEMINSDHHNDRSSLNEWFCKINNRKYKSTADIYFPSVHLIGNATDFSLAQQPTTEASEELTDVSYSESKAQKPSIPEVSFHIKTFSNVFRGTKDDTTNFNFVFCDSSKEEEWGKLFTKIELPVAIIQLYGSLNAVNVLRALRDHGISFESNIHEIPHEWLNNHVLSGTAGVRLDQEQIKMLVLLTLGCIDYADNNKNVFSNQKRSSKKIASITWADATKALQIYCARKQSDAYDFKNQGILKLSVDNSADLSLLEKEIKGSCLIESESIRCTFNDVGALSHAKELIRETVIFPLKHPQLFTSSRLLSESLKSGILLFGPPGTGKTFIAKALAKECGCSFFSVATSDLLGPYVGQSEKRVKALFSLARKMAPCVIFFDEIDSLLAKRLGNEGSRCYTSVTNEIMAEIEGLKKTIAQQNDQPQQVVIVGATNRPQALDEAVLRRFQRRILLDLPDEVGRSNILSVILKGEAVSENVDISHLATQTLFYSGSDLKVLCTVAAQLALKDSIKEMPKDNEISSFPKVQLDMKHFVEALNHVCPVISGEDSEILSSLRKWNQKYATYTLTQRKNAMSRARFGFQPASV